MRGQVENPGYWQTLWAGAFANNFSSRFLLCILFIGQTSADAVAAPRLPFPQHATYAPGAILPNHRSQAQLDEDVRVAYGLWKNNYLAQAGQEADGQSRYRVKFSKDASAKTVSEGQGYGMMIVAYLAGAEPAAQTIFDGLWEFFNDHRSAIDNRLMDWSVPADEHSGDPDGDDSAFDGDCDLAFALILADRQWGSNGRINYRHEAEQVISGILASEIGPVSRLPMLGDWVSPGGATYNQYTTRPSDFIIDHFRAFRRFTGQSVWDEVATATQQVVDAIQRNFSPTAGLLPDFVTPQSSTDHTPRPAAPDFLEGPHDGDYYYNAGRVPWRIGIDALLNRDTTFSIQTGKISIWAQNAAGGDPHNLHSGYKLDGSPISDPDYFTKFFAAPLGIAAMTQPTQQQWLNDIYDAIRGADEGYYEDTVALLCLIVMTGNVWDPTQAKLDRSAADEAWMFEAR
jgi:endo-1,4-beta-D-glucanase Y